MVSLICFIRSIFVKNEIIQVRRTPPSKVLRPHLLGLTLGFAFTSLNIVFGLTADNLFQSAIFLLWFALTAYVGGLLLFITTVFFILLKLISPPAGSFGYLFMTDAHWYFLGYAFGAVFGIFYNDLLWLFLNVFERKKIKIAFAYDPTKRINIIKSPRPEEEKALNKLFEDKPHLQERRLYRYRTLSLEEQPEQPYTIAFVANPRILRRGDGDQPLDDNVNANYETDPIVRNRELFLRGVDRAMYCFERNSVLGRPEIWSRIRLVTVFNPEVAKEANSGPQYGMIREEKTDIPGNSNSIVDPMKRMIYISDDDPGTFMHIFNKSRVGDPEAPAFELGDFDVIFGMTAWPTHDRSTSHYSDWLEPAPGVEDHLPLPNIHPEPAGPEFTFDVDPCGNKERDRHGQPISGEPSNTIFPPTEEFVPDRFRREHDFHATYPGRIALNVLGARNYTFIHEFGHAMSSVFHGTITDEYYDHYNLLNPSNGESGEDGAIAQPPHFFVNRIERNLSTMRSAAPIPVPKVFAEYNCTHYPTDLSHPPAEEGWVGYFPEKHDKATPCVMDNDYGNNRFDELLGAFMYDRLMAKTVRPHRSAMAGGKKADAKAGAKTAKSKTAKAKAKA